MPTNMDAVSSGRGNTRTNIENLAVMLTHRCQLACRYCSMDRDKPDMSCATLKRSVDFLFTSSAPVVELQFFGGEPLLRFDLIRAGIRYAEKKSRETGKKVRYLVTTNGLLLDGKKIKELSRHNVSYLLSIDGNAETQQHNRPMLRGMSAYPWKRLDASIDLLRRSGSAYFINMVVNPGNISRIDADVRYFKKKGVRQIRPCYQLGVFGPIEVIVQYHLFLAKWLAEGCGTGMEIHNFAAGDEPFFASPVVTVDHDGTLYNSCTITLEQEFPELKEVNKIGSLARIKRWDQISLSREGVLWGLARLYKQNDSRRRSILLNNLALEETDAAFFSFMKSAVVLPGGMRPEGSQCLSREGI